MPFGNFKYMYTRKHILRPTNKGTSKRRSFQDIIEERADVSNRMFFEVRDSSLFAKGEEGNYSKTIGKGLFSCRTFASERKLVFFPWGIYLRTGNVKSERIR